MNLNQGHLKLLELKYHLKEHPHSEEEARDLKIKIGIYEERSQHERQLGPQEKWRHENYFRGSVAALDGKRRSWPKPFYYLANSQTDALWFLNKEIRIYNQEGLRSDFKTGEIIRGVQNALDQIGLDFKIRFYGTDSTLEDFIEQSETPEGTDTQKLTNLLAGEEWRKPSKGGTPHANIVIIKNPSDQRIIKGSFGIGNFQKGSIIMWKSSVNVSTHEAGHLLGIESNRNHGERMDWWKSEYIDNYVGLYNDVDNCVMDWRAYFGKFCHHCHDRLFYFWKGLEKATGRKYFK